MKRLKGRLCAFFAVIILLSCLPASALAANIGNQQITSAGAFVMDFETGIHLYGYESRVRRVPASLTKLIAAYVVYDAVKAGEISFDTVTTISKKVSDFSKNKEYSNVPTDEGAKLTIGQLMEFVLVYSGCAATDALAEALCGSVEAFVKRMNAKVSALGIDAVFYDSYGGSDKNRITPHGLAVLTRCFIMDHPEVLKITSLPSTSYNGITYKNTNQLLSAYPGIDGFKTGYTGAAGYCFVGTAAQNGYRLIVVTMGSSSAQTRFPDIQKLFDYGFSTVKTTVAEFMRDKIYPASSVITVNGSEVMLTAYNIGGYHYFKLRDIAFLLNATEKQFEVQYDDDTKAVHLTSGLPYTALGDELDLIPGDTYGMCVATSSEIFLDDTQCSFEVYNINGYNYFKLRDIATLINFGVDWDNETHTVLIDTSTEYSGEYPAGESGEIDSVEPEASDPGDEEAAETEEPSGNGETAPGSELNPVGTPELPGGEIGQLAA